MSKPDADAVWPDGGRWFPLPAPRPAPCEARGSDGEARQRELAATADPEDPRAGGIDLYRAAFDGLPVSEGEKSEENEHDPA